VEPGVRTAEQQTFSKPTYKARHVKNGGMTDLYAVRVLAVDPPRRRIQLRVTAINSDVWGWPLPDASFFRRDLEDLGNNLDLLVADGDKDDQEVDDDFIESVERIATRNYPFTAETEARLVQSDGSYPIPGGFDGSFNDMSTASAKALARCEELSLGADYDVEVTDSRLIDFLEVGAFWTTTAYPD
jgi:hypothetical protein